MLDEILAKLTAMPEGTRRETEALAIEATKHMRFIPQPGPQTEAYLSKADVLLFGGSPGGGKLLNCKEKVPVPLSTDPSGYKEHGDLKAGDYVYSPTGKPVKVLTRHDTVYDPEAYEVEFDTGEVFIADAEHYWHTFTHDERGLLTRATPERRAARKAKRPSRAKAEHKNASVAKMITEANRTRGYDIYIPEGKARTTREILDTLFVEGGKRVNHSVPITAPIEAAESPLPVDPYLLGLWLGDGYTGNPYIIMMSSDWREISEHTPTPSRVWVEGVEHGRKQEVERRRFEELKPITDKIGKKRIPIEYLRASRQQRLELLRGLCDTDGTCDSRGHVEVGFSNQTLAQDTCELINSLGIKATLRVKEMRSDKHNTYYRMKFITAEKVFKLPRKLAKQKAPTRGTSESRYIIDVRKTAPVPMNCLTVEGRLYLVGRTYVTTHNTALGVGLALNEHHRSLVVRREFVDLDGVLHTLTNILKGDTTNLVGGNRPEYRLPDNGIIHFQGLGKDIDGKQGNPHDYIYIDEGAQLPEDAVRMLLGWLRTDRPGQRCRVVIGSNPPLNAVGDWLITYFGPWLDPNHPNPAKEGELRYFLPTPSGEGDRECGPNDFVVIEGVRVKPQSRTFIGSKFTDNAYYDAETYAKSLAGLPPSVRDRLTTGNFLLARPDDEFQVIPTGWIREAQARWTDRPPADVPMCAIGADIAQGGNDKTVLALRYDGWYAPLKVYPGYDTPDGKVAAGKIIANRRDNARVIVDLGGGWGGDCYGHLKENNIDCKGYMGVKASMKRTADGTLKFTNVRAEAYWRFREALDPSQEGGSGIMLPQDPELVADLTTPLFEITSNGIKITPKDKVVDLLGRSPDKGDAVVMAWWDGAKQANIQGGFNVRRQPPRVNLGRSSATRRR